MSEHVPQTGSLLGSSMVVSFDGPSKCGKTTFAQAVAGEVAYQDAFFEGEFIPIHLKKDMQPCIDRDYGRNVAFKSVHTISAGNIFRAAALHVLDEKKKGNTKEAFGQHDATIIQALLAQENTLDRLQTDPTIGASVSTVAQMMGVQAVCSELFVDMIVESYHNEGGPNLVIVDARNPVGHLKMHNKLGSGQNQIAPFTILPLYIDTPANTAAARMSGSYEENLRIVIARRKSDTTRKEMPVVPPEKLVELGGIVDWLYPVERTEVRDPLHILNDNELDLGNVQYICSVVATAVRECARSIHRNKTALGNI